MKADRRYAQSNPIIFVVRLQNHQFAIDIADTLPGSSYK